MRAFTTVTRERGVVTIPAELRQAAAVEPNTELTWVEIEPNLWLVGPEVGHPEAVAPIVAAALLTDQSPFPKLMRRLLAGEIPQRVGPGRRRAGPADQARPLTEAEMIALGEPTATPKRRRGRR